MTDDRIGTITRIVGGLAILGAILSVLSGHRFRRFRLPHILMLLFVCWVCCSCFWSVDPDGTYARVSTYTQLFVMNLLIWEFLVTEDHYHNLLQAYVLGSVVASGFVLHGYLTGTEYASLNGRYSAEGIDPNYLGVNLAYAVPMIGYIALVNRRKVLTFINYLLVLPIAFSIILTGSRAALIVSMTGFLMMIGTTIRVSLSRVLVIVALLSVGVYVMAPLVPEATMDRLTGTASEVSSGDWSTRKEIWHSGIRITMDHVFIGVGSGAFPEALKKVYTKATEAHNTYLSVLTELGIVGFVLFFGIPVSVLVRIKQLRKTEQIFCMGLLFTLALGIVSLTSECLKSTWLLFSLLILPSAFQRTYQFAEVTRSSALPIQRAVNTSATAHNSNEAPCN